MRAAQSRFLYREQSMQYEELAKVYDPLMADVDRGAWAEYISRFIPAGASVLECACGTGEMSIRLARMGYDVTATDLSEEMLLVAAQKQREEGLAKAGLRFIRMDMRALSHHKKVDCVVACCDGVNYLLSRGEVQKFFDSACAVLKPGGRLLFDISSRYKLENVLGSNCFTDNGREVAYLWQNEYDKDTKLIRMELSFFKREGGLYRRFDETHIQRAHSVRELGSWLDLSGFDWKAYGFLTEKEPEKTEERIQFIAVKR